MRQAVARLARVLGEAGIDTPLVDARILVLEAARLTARDLIVEPDRPLDEAARIRLHEFGLRRLRHEPVSRILGHREFYGRTFDIDASTLDPRADTETLIDAAVEIASREGWLGRPIRILDVGTGSGCLLVTLLAELPLATGVGTDVSVAALAMAARNARRHGVEARAAFQCTPALEDIDEVFDLLVSNPPYIPSRDLAGLAPEVREYDPRAALDGGADGLDMYRAIARGVHRVVPDGWALLEVGAGQAAEVAKILDAATIGRSAAVKLFRDLGGHDRCVALRTHEDVASG